MARKQASLHQDWARLGATARLRELELERLAIFKAFPDLSKGAPSVRSSISVRATYPVDALGRRRRTISPQGRKRMAEGMRKYWAKRKASEKKEAK